MKEGEMQVAEVPQAVVFVNSELLGGASLRLRHCFGIPQTRWLDCEPAFNAARKSPR